MKDYCNIVAYFQYVDEITNTLEGLGELVDEKTIIQNILRMLPGRFNPKVSVLEYNENLDKLSKEELHGVLIAYEKRLDEEEG
ncbi:retrotransposon gag domain-containing protein, partial [Bacteroides uniformis]|uniref:retrotransposon gag domain-containing protein n=1 Tax=Bacteroides uniformis TaxID=820 RepID=UPI001FB763ED